jgi:uncharacterized membrane protein (DUF373 family)
MSAEPSIRSPNLIDILRIASISAVFDRFIGVVELNYEHKNENSVAVVADVLFVTIALTVYVE